MMIHLTRNASEARRETQKIIYHNKHEGFVHVVGGGRYSRELALLTCTKEEGL